MRVRCLTATAIVIWCGMGLSVVAQRSSAPYPKWEYKILNSCNEEDRKVDIHKLGEEGWELVNADASNCLTYYFKRPLREGVKPTATLPAPTAPSKPGAPQCSLPLEKAPVIRGLRLGMSIDELWVLFPGRADEWNYKSQLTDADKPPKYGAVQLTFRPLSNPNKESIFDGVREYRIVLLDGRVSEINVLYRFSEAQSVFWTNENWIAKLSEAFGLPGAESWLGKDEKQIICNGFELKTSITIFPGGPEVVPVRLSSPRLTITDTAFRKIVEQRIKDDHEKRRREFKF